MKIINLTLRRAGRELKRQGVFEHNNRKEIVWNLIFPEIPDHQEMARRANHLARISKEQNADMALIEGPPYFITFLEASLLEQNIKPIYMFNDCNKEKQNCIGFIDGGLIVEAISALEHARAILGKEPMYCICKCKKIST